MSKLLFLIHEGVRNIWRHKLTATTAIISVFLVLLVIGSFIVIHQNSHHLIDKVRSEYNIEAFFNADISDEDAAQLVQQISLLDGIESVKLITKQDALLIYQDEFGEDLNEILGHNPLPASAVIELTQQGNEQINVEPIINTIEVLPNVDEVVYEGTLIRRIEYFYSTIMRITSYIALVLLVITVIVISNTVKLSVYAKQDLIQDLRSVGATKLFIKTPFIIEGILEGIIGAILSIGVIILLVNTVNKYFSDIVTFLIDFNLIGAVWITLIAAIIGFIGSYRGTRVLLK